MKAQFVIIFILINLNSSIMMPNAHFEYIITAYKYVISFLKIVYETLAKHRFANLTFKVYLNVIL